MVAGWRVRQIDQANFVYLERRDSQIEVSPLSKRASASSAAADVVCAAMVSMWMCADELACGALAELTVEYKLDPISAFCRVPFGRQPVHKMRVFADCLEPAVIAIWSFAF